MTGWLAGAGSWQRRLRRAFLYHETAHFWFEDCPAWGSSTDCSRASRSSSCRSCWGSSGSRARTTTMTLEWVHPGLVLIVGAWLVPLLKGRSNAPSWSWCRRLRSSTAFSWIRASTASCASLAGAGVRPGRSLEPRLFVRLRADGARGNDLRAARGRRCAACRGADLRGRALGVTFAGDFLSLFLFWELMAVSAALLVWLRRAAHRGGRRISVSPRACLRRLVSAGRDRAVLVADGIARV